MGLKTLRMENVHEIDQGSVGIAANRAFNNVHNDLRERPTLEKPRKVVIEIEFLPKASERGELIDIEVIAVIHTKTPPQRTSTRASSGASGMFFQPHTPGNPDQMDFLTEDEDIER